MEIPSVSYWHRGSRLAADYKKRFNDLTIQAEVQFGNMARWYSDIFKFQAAYSQGLIDIGLCIVPTQALASRIDSNITNFERIGGSFRMQNSQ